MIDRQVFAHSRRLVIKIGSALITNKGKGLDAEAIQRWAAQMAELRSRGIELLLVSSGAVAEGMARMGMVKRPRALHELQAVAALGQMGLIQQFESCFKTHGIHTAQVLLTHDDLSSRQRYLNARSTLRTLLAMGTIPIINENDTVATEEIRVGDNDNLSALVANLIEADLLMILTDQPGLFTADPRSDANAQLIRTVTGPEIPQPLWDAVRGSAGKLGIGGMQTKLQAADLARRSGSETIIASGSEENVILRLVAGEKLGTRFLPIASALDARKRYILTGNRSNGELVADFGAAQALKEGGSLLPVGVMRASGEFERGDTVRILDPDGKEIARGLTNYNADDVNRIYGRQSSEIENILGFAYGDEVIHRSNMVLL
jgi:glutamate 5-kinase